MTGQLILTVAMLIIATIGACSLGRWVWHELRPHRHHPSH